MTNEGLTNAQLIEKGRINDYVVGIESDMAMMVKIFKDVQNKLFNMKSEQDSMKKKVNELHKKEHVEEVKSEIPNEKVELINGIEGIEFTDGTDFEVININGTIKLKGKSRKHAISNTAEKWEEIYESLPTISQRKDYTEMKYKKTSGLIMRYFAFSGKFNCKLYQVKGVFTLVKE